METRPTSDFLKNYLIKEEVTLTNYPIPDEFAIPDTDAQFTIGDLHGNALKLLFMLVKQKIVSMFREDYKLFVDIYYKDVDQLTKEDIDLFNRIINQMEVRSCLIRLIGDELADRGKNDYFTLRLIKKLKQTPNMDLRILLSNHSFEIFYNENSADFKDRLILPDEFCISMLNMKKLIDKEIIEIDEVNSLLKNDYKPCVKLIDYSLSRDNNTFTFYSHAPVDIRIIENLLWQLHLPTEKIDLNNIQSIAQSIDIINEQFTIEFVNKNKVKTLIKSVDDNNEAVGFLIMNRSYDILQCNDKIGLSNLLYIHGHDKAQVEQNITVPHMITTDSDLGKGGINYGTYLVLYSHDYKECNFQKNYFWFADDLSQIIKICMNEIIDIHDEDERNAIIKNTISFALENRRIYSNKQLENIYYVFHKNKTIFEKLSFLNNEENNNANYAVKLFLENIKDNPTLVDIFALLHQNKLLSDDFISILQHSGEKIDKQNVAYVCQLIIYLHSLGLLNNAKFIKQIVEKIDYARDMIICLSHIYNHHPEKLEKFYKLTKCLFRLIKKIDNISDYFKIINLFSLYQKINGIDDEMSLSIQKNYESIKSIMWFFGNNYSEKLILGMINHIDYLKNLSEIIHIYQEVYENPPNNPKNNQDIETVIAQINERNRECYVYYTSLISKILSLNQGEGQDPTVIQQIIEGEKIKAREFKKSGIKRKAPRSTLEKERLFNQGNIEVQQNNKNDTEKPNDNIYKLGAPSTCAAKIKL